MLCSFNSSWSVMDQFSIFSTCTVTLLQSQQEISVDPRRCCLHWQHRQLNPSKDVFSGMYLFWFQSARGTNADENCSSSLSTHSYLYHSICPRLGQFVGATDPMPAEQLLCETGSSRPVLTNETQMISRYINQVLSGPVPGTALTSPWGADCTALTPQGWLWTRTSASLILFSHCHEEETIWRDIKNRYQETLNLTCMIEFQPLWTL